MTTMAQRPMQRLTLAPAQLQPPPQLYGATAAQGAQKVRVRQTADAGHVRHCVLRPLRLREAQASIRVAGSEEEVQKEEEEEREQGPISVVQTSGEPSALPVQAAAVSVAGVVSTACEGGRYEHNRVHENSHGHNHILSAHNQHIRVLLAHLAQKPVEVVEEAGHRGPARSHSHSHSHSHSRVHSQRHDMSDGIRPPPLGKRE